MVCVPVLTATPSCGWGWTITDDTDIELDRALSHLDEGVVHECLISCRGHAVPVGCVRRGSSVHVRLFPGRMRDALLEEGNGAVHLTHDPLVLLAALEGSLSEEGDGPVPRIAGCFASITVKVARQEAKMVSDGIGETNVISVTLRPDRAVISVISPRPLSRGDGQLMEALVHATRARVSTPEQRREWLERVEIALDIVQRTRPDGEDLASRIRALAGDVT
ncbi:MAG: DUF447 family protein [Candidatus Undinarchaeales archaeon]|nr:DUF447 family protein [Candidatus Undinarchaeales archaeon]MDP7493911.1 DUF447 family protein [Candidatus Undinarchaeales archaeon]